MAYSTVISTICILSIQSQIFGTFVKQREQVQKPEEDNLALWLERKCICSAVPREYFFLHVLIYPSFDGRLTLYQIFIVGWVHSTEETINIR